MLDVLKKYNSSGSIPAQPDAIIRKDYGNADLTQCASLLDNLDILAPKGK